LEMDVTLIVHRKILVLVSLFSFCGVSFADECAKTVVPSSAKDLMCICSFVDHHSGTFETAQGVSCLSAINGVVGGYSFASAAANRKRPQTLASICINKEGAGTAGALSLKDLAREVGAYVAAHPAIEGQPYEIAVAEAMVDRHQCAQ